MPVLPIDIWERNIILAYGDHELSDERLQAIYDQFMTASESGYGLSSYSVGRLIFEIRRSRRSWRGPETSSLLAAAEPEMQQRLLSDESTESIVTDLVARALSSHPDMQAPQREDEAYEDRVINGDPSAEAPRGLLHA